MRNADGVILVYDINNSLSFEKVNFWLKAVRQVTKESTTVYLFGNKLDLVQENKNFRKVPIEKVLKYISDNKISNWVECSAKLNINLKESFEKFYMEVYNKQKIEMEQRTKSLTDLYQTSIGNYPKFKQNCC